MIKFQQSQALTSHFESFWSVVKGYFQFFIQWAKSKNSFFFNFSCQWWGSRMGSKTWRIKIKFQQNFWCHQSRNWLFWTLPCQRFQKFNIEIHGGFDGVPNSTGSNLGNIFTRSQKYFVLKKKRKTRNDFVQRCRAK